MRIVFRADASQTLGTGHVMRCLTLAEALRDEGWTAEFICREANGDLSDFVENKGFPVHRLPADCIPEEDARQSAAYLQHQRPDWLVVDNYALDAAWERQLRPYAQRRLVIDDLADRPHDCDLLLDQNLADDNTRYDSLVPAHCLKLLGPKYALLRPEFAEARATLPERTGRVERLLVSFGGSDESNETAKVLDALTGFDLPSADLSAAIVVGKSYPYRAELEARCRNNPKLELHVQTGDMAALMARADLALGAGGSTTWERSCLGLPSLVVSTADNQIPVAESAARHGAQIYLGKAADVSAAQWASALAFALDYPAVLRNLAQAGTALVDGRGAARVARALRNLSTVSVRPAQPSDMERVYEWRNHETVRRVSFSSAPLVLTQHRTWFERVLADPERHLLIGEWNGTLLGVIRYDVERLEHHAEVSLFLAPECQGRGLGLALLAAGEAWLQANCAEVTHLTARVKTDNPASYTLFDQAGYRPRATTLQKRLTR